MITFDQLGLNAPILESISELGFVNPSPIQAEVIPCVLETEGDIVGLAQTGTGKTAAFGLPVLNLIDTNLKQIQALVLAPTRELGLQIAVELRKYSTKMAKTRVCAVYGGEDIRKQLRELDNTPQILVATPGRLIDLINRGKVNLSNIKFLVLDEADEMLKMGFIDDITTIIETTPETRRTLLFSATMPKEIANIAKRYMENAREISVGKRNEAAKNVEHNFVAVKGGQRYEVLKRLLDFYPEIYGIVFCRTRQETKDVAEKLMIDGYNADALHGDLSQAQRDSVMSKFRIKHLQILVATDVAARGLDVNDLTHVIHYMLPDDKETYTHRSGRTGRVNKSGISIALITGREKSHIRGLEKEINRTFTHMNIPSGNEVCQKKLMHLSNQIIETEINTDLAKFLPTLIESMNDISKEDLLLRFITLEYKRFFEYYKEAPDLNVSIRMDKTSDSEQRPSRREMRRGDKGDTLRLKINKGRNDGFEPRRLLGLINEVTNDKSIAIGDIDISPKFTFFDVPKNQVQRLIEAFETSPKSKNISIGEVKGIQNAPREKSNSRRERSGDKGRAERDSRSRGRDGRDGRDGGNRSSRDNSKRSGNRRK